MNLIKRTASLLLVAVMLVSVFAASAVPASAAAFTIQRQWDSQWKSVYVGGRTLYDTACGIFSIVNAVGYLTGDAPDVVSAAKWANSIGAFNTASFGGTDRSVLYPRIQAKYGETYGFTCDVGTGSGYWAGSSSTKLKNHLANGGVAIGHVPGHFIAIVGYDPSTNYFHVYDSAPSSTRGTATYGDTGLGDCWVTQSRLATGKLALDWFCLLSSTGPSVSEEYLALEGLIYDSLGLICVDYTNSEVIAIRAAYTNAVAVLNNESSTDTDYQNAYNALYAAIHPTANIISVGKGYSTSANTRTDIYADNLSRLTDGVKGEPNGGNNYSGWNGSATVTVDLGSDIASNTYTVYFAGGAWGISSPVENINVAVSYSIDGVNYTPIASSNKAVLKNGSGITVDGEDSWSTYELTLTGSKIYARYIRFELVHINGGHIWIDEVEVADYPEPFLTDRFYVNGMNTSVVAGQCVIFTSGFGEITAAKANHRWTRNIIATINPDGSFTVDEVFVGDGDGVKSVTLTDDQIMIAAHPWEGVSDSVPGSLHNVSILSSANVGDNISFSGVTTALGYYDVLAYGTITPKACSHSYDSVVTAPTCTAQGFTTHTCSLCGDSYTANYVPASHTEGEWVTLGDGSKEKRCSVCGTLLGFEEAPEITYETGDVNADGKINMFDYLAVKSAYFSKTSLDDGAFLRADINSDGKVNIFDYLAIKSVCMA